MPGPTPSAIFGLLSSQIGYSPPEPKASFQGQTAIVTGANAGLGREVTRYVVALGAAKVILAVRTVSKGEEARECIEKATGRKGCMEVWPLDMASFKSVRDFAERAKALQRLDVLVCNAGVWPNKFELVEGYEATIAVNVLSTFLLTRLLTPKMLETATSTKTIPRISIVDSSLHKFAKLPSRKSGSSIFRALNEPLKPADYDNRYNDSKLLVLFYGQKLAATLNSSSICLNFVNPGWCKSNLHPNEGGFAGRMAERALIRTTDEGARIIVDAVDGQRAKGRHGAYLNDCKVEKPMGWIETKEGQETRERVWREGNEILGF